MLTALLLGGERGAGEGRKDKQTECQGVIKSRPQGGREIMGHGGPWEEEISTGWREQKSSNYCQGAKSSLSLFL